MFLRKRTEEQHRDNTGIAGGEAGEASEGGGSPLCGGTPPPGVQGAEPPPADAKRRRRGPGTAPAQPQRRKLRSSARRICGEAGGGEEHAAAGPPPPEGAKRPMKGRGADRPQPEGRAKSEAKRSGAVAERSGALPGGSRRRTAVRPVGRSYLATRLRACPRRRSGTPRLTRRKRPVQRAAADPRRHAAVDSDLGSAAGRCQ